MNTVHRHKNDNSNAGKLGADGSWDVGKHVTDSKIIHLRREGNGGIDKYSLKCLK